MCLRVCARARARQCVRACVHRMCVLRWIIRSGRIVRNSRSTAVGDPLDACTHAHTHARTHARTHTHVARTRTHARAHAHTHTRTRRHAQTRTRTRKLARMRAHARWHARTHTHTHAHTHTHVRARARTECAHACTHLRALRQRRCEEHEEVEPVPPACACVRACVRGCVCVQGRGSPVVQVRVRGVRPDLRAAVCAHERVCASVCARVCLLLARWWGPTLHLRVKQNPHASTFTKNSSANTWRATSRATWAYDVPRGRTTRRMGIQRATWRVPHRVVETAAAGRALWHAAWACGPHIPAA
jgi:hypothetical protein